MKTATNSTIKKKGKPAAKKKAKPAPAKVTSPQKTNLVIIRSAAAKRIKERREMREHLAPFIRKTFETVDPGADYMHAWYIDLMAEYLEAVANNEITNLVINIPPRFLKSICTTIAWPAWLLGRTPSEQILVASYSEKLSMKHSVDCRLVVESAWYRNVFPEVQIARDQNEKSKFTTTKRGHRIATSVGGTATGEGGNILLLDDPINPKKALSDIERIATNDWVDQTWSTRKNNPKRSHEVVVMQRLHTNDTTGHVLGQGSDGWEHLVLPQVAETKTIVIFPRSKKKITRKENDLLHPERMGQVEVDRIKTRLGTYGFAGQHQQRPTPRGGGRIKIDWFPRHKALPDEPDEIILSFDTAQKEKEVNDPSVGGVFLRKGVQWYMVNIWKDRVRYPELKKKVIAMDEYWKPDAILIEDKSSGESLIQELHEDTSLPVLAIEPEASKIIRLDTQTPSLEAGVLSLPDPLEMSVSWLSSMEECLMHFPNPPEWNELDMLSQFLKHIRKRSMVFDVMPFSVISESNWRGR